MSAVRLPALALAAGTAGGAVAALSMIGWAWLAPPPVGRAGEAVGLLGALVLAQAGVRACARLEARFARRLVAAGLIALSAALVSSLGAFALYVWLQPTLLAGRQAALEAAAHGDPAALARLAAARIANLDPRFQALGAGGVVGFFTLLLGCYVAFRGQVAARLARRLPPD